MLGDLGKEVVLSSDIKQIEGTVVTKTHTPPETKTQYVPRHYPAIGLPIGPWKMIRKTIPAKYHVVIEWAQQSYSTSDKTLYDRLSEGQKVMVIYKEVRYKMIYQSGQPEEQKRIEVVDIRPN